MSAKYKVGDVLVWVHTNDRGRSILLTEPFGDSGFNYRFLDGATSDSHNSFYIFELYCEFEYVTKSPLFQELR